jgi:hypothetical protein
MPTPSTTSSDDMWTRRLAFDGGIHLTVREEWHAGIGGTVWQGSIIAGRFLASPAFTAARMGALPPGARAIELGAGVTGVPSLILAALAARTGCLAEIVVTDTCECLEGLEAAARANAPPGASVVVAPAPAARVAAPASEGGDPSDGWALPRSVVEAVAGEAGVDGRLSGPPSPPPPPPPLPGLAGGEGGRGSTAAASQAPTRHPTPPHPVTLRVAELDWGSVTPALVAAPLEAGGLGGPFDLVVVADCVYHPPAMEALVRAMRLLTAPGGQALLAFYERSVPAASQFWPRLRAGFAVTHVPAAAYGCAGADAVATRADGSAGPVVGMFDLVRVGEAEYGRREAARRKGPGACGIL